MHRIFASALCALLLAVGLVTLGSGTAVACSCEESDASTLDRADAVFVGTVQSLDDVDDRYEDERAYLATITVDRDLKDNLDDTIHVRSYRDDGGNCGLNLSTGEQIEATVHVDDEGWFLTDGCSLVYGDILDTWSPPVGVGGTAEVFVTTYSAPYRFIAFGPTGERLAFGEGGGRTLLMGLCEDDATLAEVVAVDGYGEIFVELRSLETFEITDSIPLVVDGDPYIASEVTCSADLGEIAIWGRPTDRPADDRAVVYEDGAWTEVDGAVQPRTRSARKHAGWPLVQLSGGEIRMQNDFDTFYELDATVDVPATQPPVVEVLGAGMGPSTDGDGASSSTAAYWVIGFGAVVIAVVGAYVLSRGRAA